MSRFLERQLASAEAMKLGRAEHFYDYDAEKNQMNVGERPGNAATRPRNVTAEAFPVGRRQGVCVPGAEDVVGRMEPGLSVVGGARPALKKYRKPNR